MANHHSLGRVGRGNRDGDLVLPSSFPHFQIKLFVFMQCYQHELLSWKHTLTDSVRVGFRNETAFSFVYSKRSSSLQNWKP